MRAVAFLFVSACPALAGTVTEYERNAEAWLASVENPEARAFDEFVPGLADAQGCLTKPGEPVVLTLDGGIITLRALDSNGGLDCAIFDGSGEVSDGHIVGPIPDPVTLEIQFAPSITAFYGYYGSLMSGRTVTMRLYNGPDLIDDLESSVSPESVYAFGHGFRSTIPIDRLEFNTGEDDGNGITLLGAFVGLAPGETSLGHVFISGYAGEFVPLDFGLVWLPCDGDIDGDMLVGISDLLLVLAQWGQCPPECPGDVDGNGTVDITDLLLILANWGACPS